MLVEVGEGDRVAAEAPGQGLRIVERAIGHDQASNLRLGQVPCRQLDRFTGADQQHAGLGKVGEDAFGQAHRGECDRNRVGADARVRAHALGHGEGVLEQPLERSIERPGIAREGIGILDLAEDLRFAEDHRFEARGHAKQVANGVGIVVAVEEFLDVRAVQLTVPVQPVERRAFGTGFDIAVKLGAITGGKDGGLAHPRLGDQIGQRAGGGVGRECGALAQGNRCAEMVEAECNQCHACNHWRWRGSKDLRADRSLGVCVE